jgi:hypothetical protein
MDDLFVKLLFGHIVGDFFLQNKWMAVNKSASHFKSTIHVGIYTIAVMLFTQFNLAWALTIFIPHYIIDRYSLADKWLKLIHGRSLMDFFQNGHKNIPESNINEETNYWMLRGGFTALVYTIVDNGAHLMCLWYGYKLLFT